MATVVPPEDGLRDNGAVSKAVSISEMDFPERFETKLK